MQICRVIEIFQIEIGTYLTVADAIRPHLLVMLHTPFPLPLLIAPVSTFHFRVKQQDRCVCVWFAGFSFHLGGAGRTFKRRFTLKTVVSVESSSN